MNPGYSLQNRDLSQTGVHLCGSETRLAIRAKRPAKTPLRVRCLAAVA